MKQKLPEGPFRVIHIEDTGSYGGLGGDSPSYEVMMVSGQGDTVTIGYTPYNENHHTRANPPKINQWFNAKAKKGGTVEMKLERTRGAQPITGKLVNVNLNKRKP